MWIASDPRRFLGQTVGTGQCVAFVCVAAGAPPTRQWHRGAHVGSEDALPVGTAIATFDSDGRYGNHTDGRSHAAILCEIVQDGLKVLDQWAGSPVAERVIRWNTSASSAANDGNAYFVIEERG